MFYTTEFDIPRHEASEYRKPNRSAFSVIINNHSNGMETSKYSLINAVKPLTYCTTVCGTRLFKYAKNGIKPVNVCEKIYSVILISAFVAIMAFVSPASWHETKADIPLNILTKTFGLHHNAEVFYSILIVSFGNSYNYVKLFQKLDDIDNHFGTSKLLFKRRLFMSGVLILYPMILTSFTFWLRKFNVRNISAHGTLFLIILQGSIFCFLLTQIYMKYLSLNELIMRKGRKCISQEKEIICKDSLWELLFKKITVEPLVVRDFKTHYCWFELMQIYDKISDCIHIFNSIYSGQVLIMFHSWLLCTLLIICRSLSPTVKYSTVILSDIFIYTCINSRPLFLAIMCELFLREKRRTRYLLLNILTYEDLDKNYYVQVQTMIDLVETRKAEISANVFTIDVPTVMNFAGRVISYAVLMIQYFYMHLFQAE